jgi:hypothetical protein
MPGISLKRDFQKRFPGPFTYFEGRDGVDDTFDVHCLTSDQTIVSTYYWDERQTALRQAAAISFALNAYLLTSDTIMSPEDAALLQQFLAEYPGPYRSEREFCEYRGPGYRIVSGPHDEHVIAVYGGYFHRQTRSIARMITQALNALPNSDLAVSSGDDEACDPCPRCGGELQPLGQLGWLTHHRCRHCGISSSKKSLLNS